MLNIKRIVCNMIQENCYIVSDDSKECIIVDCGAYYTNERKAIVEYIRKNELTPKHLVATHGHIDHIFGNNTIFEEFGLRAEMHAADKFLIEQAAFQAEQITGVRLEYDMPPVGKYLTDKDVIAFGNHIFTIIETPGHSPGSIFLYCEKEHVAFSGDTLFHYSIGRTDLEGGSMFQIIQSIRMICQLPDDTVIYPGHGDKTTIGIELAGNPYMDR
ncbi:MBL fold metallo-hydrolase [Hoylesella oralis]|uniref:MBL fold metallo-hydrolase n=1 Tax=Hoylesella oralis TaxID=28134 RepID=UPI0028E3BD3F|nr:MBL fold metallo-hydrolase [Hoylesella oralis]